MVNPWVVEIWRLVALVFVALIVGMVVGQPMLLLLLAVSAYLVLHLSYLYRLYQWLQGNKKSVHLGDVPGIWGDIFHYLNRLQKRNRKSKKRLASMLRRFQQSTNALPDATVVLKKGNIIDVWNEMASRRLGLKYPADNGQPITNFLRHPDFRHFLEQDDSEARMQIPSPVDEQVFLLARLVPYGDNQKLLVLRDVTHMRRLEQMRQDFVANVSHELRTPLTVVRGYLEALQEEKEEALLPWMSVIHSMEKQSIRMQGIVTDLLLLSRLEIENDIQEGEDIDIPALLNMIHEDVMLLSDGKHHISFDIDAQLLLCGSRDEIHSAFSNLLFNAVRYTPEAGNIDVRWYADENAAYFEVKDSGIGIDAQHIPRLTERFYRIDVGRSRDLGGTGLGLAIVKHVLLRHDASLIIESERGEGSTFICKFPLSLVIRRDASIQDQVAG